jgi:hypothetical protein
MDVSSGVTINQSPHDAGLDAGYRHSEYFAEK